MIFRKIGDVVQVSCGGEDIDIAAFDFSDATGIGEHALGMREIVGGIGGCGLFSDDADGVHPCVLNCFFKKAERGFDVDDSACRAVNGAGGIDQDFLYVIRTELRKFFQESKPRLPRPLPRRRRFR